MVLATWQLAAAFVPPAPAALVPGLDGRAARLRACTPNLAIAQVRFLNQPRLKLIIYITRAHVTTSSLAILGRFLGTHTHVRRHMIIAAAGCLREVSDSCYIVCVHINRSTSARHTSISASANKKVCASSIMGVEWVSPCVCLIIMCFALCVPHQKHTNVCSHVCASLILSSASSSASYMCLAYMMNLAQYT